MARKISEKAKKVLAVILAFLIGLMAIIGGFNIYFSVIGKQKQYGTASGEFWSPNQTFQLEDIPAIELGNKDFKILVITDIHLKNHATFAAFLGVNYVLDWAGSIALNRMVEEVQPDLMLVLGDTTLTARNDIEYERFVRQMDRYEVPWACVFGNHDDEGRTDKAKLVDILLTSKNGLFEYGPSDLHGAGNYVIRLTRDGKTEQALFLMDSGSSLEFPEQKDGINAKQVSWYQWNMEGFKAKEGNYPKNMAFFHIPLPVYADLNSFTQGERAEDTCPGNTDGGLVSAMQRLNGTHLFAAHDHNNNFIAEKDGLKICYAMKSSYNCYFKFGMTGGTLLTVHPDRQVTEELIYF